MNKFIITILLITSAVTSKAQNINWQSLNPNTKSIAYLNIGYDFGMTTQLGFAKMIKAKKPFLLSADYSLPMGETLQDDFKVRLGGQMAIVEKNNFIAAIKIYSITRRHQTSLVRMMSFGSEFGGVIGYHKPNWHIAGEFGFDKSISTHLKHTDAIRDNYSGVTDGWYVPTGGNFYYGLQVSRAIGQQLEFSFKMGATDAQGKDYNALLPKYAAFGFSWSFDSSSKK